MSDSAAAGTIAMPAGIEPLAKRHYRYALWLLMLIYLVNFLDRQIINILAEPIKRDLHLADWQIGAMSGLAFALFYTVLGLPIARWSERGNRPLIIATAVILWSTCTAACGLARNFGQLLVARVGVGVGEAGCTPPAHSLISDYVPQEKRNSAIAFYGIGGPLGGLFGMAMGGLIADAFGWRAAFFVVAIPGVLLGILAATTLREPRRAASLIAKTAEPATMRFKEAMSYLLKKRSYCFIVLALSANACLAYGAGTFTASLLIRSHGDAIAELSRQIGEVVPLRLGTMGLIGLAMGLLTGVFGTVGMISGGWLADRFGIGDRRRLMHGTAIACFAKGLALLGLAFAPGPLTAFACIALFGFFGSVWYGPVYGSTMGVVPPHLRATASAVSLFMTNLIGLGMGPLAIGLLSDMFAASNGSADGLRMAIAVASMVAVISASCFWTSARTLREDWVG